MGSCRRLTRACLSINLDNTNWIDSICNVECRFNTVSDVRITSTSDLLCVNNVEMWLRISGINAETVNCTMAS